MFDHLYITSLYKFVFCLCIFFQTQRPTIYYPPSGNLNSTPRLLNNCLNSFLQRPHSKTKTVTFNDQKNRSVKVRTQNLVLNVVEGHNGSQEGISFQLDYIDNCRNQMKENAKQAYRIIEDNIAMFHKYTVISAVCLFTISIVLMVFSNNQYNSVAISRLMLYNSSALFILAEMFRLIKNWELKSRFTLTVLAIETLGYTLMGLTALRADFYNRGISYMVASFLISIAKELNIVHLLVPKNQLKQKRYQFLSSLNSCCAALMFFFAALVSSFWGEEGQRSMIVWSLSGLSGLLMSLSVFYTIKDQQYEGYSTMALSMSDER